MEKAKLKEQFAYVASHDLQEPIRTILSLTDLMIADQSNPLSNESKKTLDFIQESGERMTQQIKGLLEYSRLGRGQRLEKVDINSILSEVEKDLKRPIAKTGAKIITDSLPIVIGYRLELRSVFQNLISNSIKFTEESVIPKVGISYTENAEEWTFSVQDNGIGIKPSQFEKIFKLFQRLNGRHEYTGIGLGLALCKHIVELHKGTIWVEAAPDTGSIFKFTLSKHL